MGAPGLQYLHIETIWSIDDVVNDGGLLLVQRLHGDAASIVLDPLQNQIHDVDAEMWTTGHFSVCSFYFFFLQKKILINLQFALMWGGILRVRRTFDRKRLSLYAVRIEFCPF